ncbi:MAG: nuclear transport factor 2 family protein [Dehalococcoidia bacterium]|nr:MAG: nuclear transport factor 2 family protein [Dehalococcoidia bacterium]
MAELADLETQIRVLGDIEAIKKLKAKYWRCIDKKLWDELEDCFVEDAVADYGKNLNFQGRKAIIQFLKDNLGSDSVITVHQGHNPEIEITSDTTSRGIWALHDYLVFQPNITINGWGHYEDEYVKQNGEWKKKSIKETRLREEWTRVK